MVFEKTRTFPVILSGGSGTRLWPASRSERPKQFMPIVTDRTMMQDTIARLPAEAGFERPVIVSNAAHAATVVDQAAQIGVDPAAIFLEPAGRNTAGAIALPALWLLDQFDDALILVMPSDHVIRDVSAFHKAIEAATPAAREGRLVTFGIRATYPETGYGYIEQGEPLGAVAGVYAVKRFVEKPTLDVAKTFVRDGNFHWNGGIFLFSARAYIAELTKFEPGVVEACRKALASARTDGALIYPDRDAFMQCPDQSIDYAVMEKTGSAAVVPADMGWSDVGSWEALWGIRERDAAGNSVKGGAVLIDCESNLVYVDGGPPVAAIGVENLVIVSTENGILVMPQARSQDVKKVVEQVKAGAFD